MFDFVNLQIAQLRNEAITLAIILLRQFSSPRSLEVPDFWEIIHQLCETAPNIANAIARMEERSKASPSREQLNASVVRSTTQKRKNQDPSYRPPKSTRHGGSSKLNASRSSLAECIADPNILARPENDPDHIHRQGNIYRANESPPCDNILPSRPLKMVPSLVRPTSIIDLTIETTRTLHQLSKHQENVPRDVHKRILEIYQNLDANLREASTSRQWSDGSMWLRVLEKGSSNRTQITILNMLEYMGAWEWYDDQVRLAETKILTQKGKPVARRGAATHVLDSIQTRTIGGVGPVTLRDGSSGTPGCGPDSVIEKEMELKRNSIRVQLLRGQKLSTKLVKKLGLGILFSPNVWTYTKMSGRELDNIVQDIIADSEHMKLLQILRPQLQRLVNNGRPDLPTFFADLKWEKLIAEGELRQLKEAFILEHDSLPEGKLEATIDSLLKDITEKVLKQHTLDENDTVTLNGRMEISCDSFQRFRPGRWLDSWAIMAGMQISDKPSYVRYDLSIPLHELGTKKQLREIKQPLAGWANKIAKHREQARNTSGSTVPLAYYCPINHYNKHFTLLEINERKGLIRHYDSMADPDIIAGREASRISTLIQEEFGYLDFQYEEAPTPQQIDGWSCGIRVVWNFRHLSNDLGVGSWDTVLNPEHIILQVVQGLAASVEERSMEKYRR